MAKRKIPHMCITCKNYQPYHCELDDNYVGYIHAGEVNKCRAWRLSDDYKKGGKFYGKEGEQDDT